MEQQELARIKELLNRTTEFVAYFELVETKMIEWQQNIEQQLQDLSSETSLLREMITETGLSQLKQVGDNLLNQSQEMIEKSEKIQHHIASVATQNHQELQQLCQEITLKISRQSDEATDKIEQQLQQYDIGQFNRIANESCDYVATCAKNAVHKSHKLLQLFHWRSVMMSIFIAIISVFVCSLYMNDEYPWELHQHVQNERNAGKMLMSAWAQLTPRERSKILSQQA